MTALDVLRQTVGLVGDNTVGELHVLAEAACEHLAEKTYIILFQIFIDVWAGYLQQKRLRLLGKMLEDDGRKPRFVLLLGDVLPDYWRYYFLNDDKTVSCVFSGAKVALFFQSCKSGFYRLFLAPRVTDYKMSSL